ncbi:phosphatidate cytidylyltransferase [Streptomyces sp. NPDC046716]|uniref:phosphatidate cytidylyltransferase n=1 Tax=Streptomyces sp. NPDC046716 TaxID=3157093 RepID=UPI0033F59B00
MTTAASLAPWLGGALALAGAGVAASRRRELMLRWCAWAVGVPLITGAFWLGDAGAAAVATAAALIAVHELAGLLNLPRTDRAVLAAAVAAVILTAWLAPAETLRAGAAGALAVVAVPLVSGDADHGLRRATAALFGLAWLSLLAALVPLGADALALFVAVSVADIAAYFAGPRLGGPHLSPLSPAKRWSGTLAGAAAGVGALALLGAADWRTALAVAVGGPAGDLVESMVKRGARQKDAGRWLAGTGGLLDRVDSLLGALAVLLVLN